MQHFLDKLMNPKSVAFLGASNNFTTMGTGQLYVLRTRFKGKIYPVHPTETTILGFPAFKTLEDLPEVPDILIIVLPTRLVIDYLEKAGQFGIRHVIIVSAGFSEVGESENQTELNNIAQHYGIRFIGPNCIGIINLHCSQGIFNCTWFPFELPEGMKGSVSLISQSGSWISQILIWMERRGIRLGKAVSVGNEANIDVTDCMEYFRDDPDTKVVGAYIEGVKREGRQFVQTLRELAQKKPVVVHYVGGTKAGSRAGMSHTASLGGKASVYETIFKQAGAIETTTMEELYEYLHAFSLTYPPKGNRVGLITNSGGPAVTFANSCERYGLSVHSFSSDLQNKIRGVIRSTASANNPIDLTFDMNMDLFYREVPRLIWQSGEVDVLLMYGVFGGNMMERMFKFGNNEFMEMLPAPFFENMLRENLKDFVAWVHENRIPVLISCLDTADEAVTYLQDNGIAVFKWPSMAARAMKAMVDYYSKRGI
ncbi:MAG: acetate--CoA ligase family protein [Candidatus Hodarchaeota archaeon]